MLRAVTLTDLSDATHAGPSSAATGCDPSSQQYGHRYTQAAPDLLTYRDNHAPFTSRCATLLRLPTASSSIADESMTAWQLPALLGSNALHNGPNLPMPQSLGADTTERPRRAQGFTGAESPSVEPLVRCVEQLVTALTQRDARNCPEAQQLATHRHAALENDRSLHCSKWSNRTHLWAHRMPTRNYVRSRAARNPEYDAEEHWESREVACHCRSPVAFSPPKMPADLMRRLVQLAPDLAIDFPRAVVSDAGEAQAGHVGAGPQMSLPPALLQGQNVRHPEEFKMARIHAE
jgi:hypothetical protein